MPNNSNLSPRGRKAARKKPAKPYPDFPLFPHATGRWAKKICGKFHYFGPREDPDAALQKYLDQRDDLHAGRQPQPSSDGLTIRELVNRFLSAKRRLYGAHRKPGQFPADPNRRSSLLRKGGNSESTANGSACAAITPSRDAM